MRLKASDSMARHARVSVDGEDVTDRCFEVDDAAGWAACYVRSPKGGFWRVGDTAVTQMLYGEVKIEFTKPGHMSDEQWQMLLGYHGVREAKA